MKLHDDLGVPQDAEPDAIKGAYRDLARKLHPDQPTGDEEAFKRAAHAYLILSDPVKRKQYEETGDENTASPEERERAMATERIAQVIAGVLDAPEFDPAKHDLLKIIRKNLKQQRQKANEELDSIIKALAKLRKTLKRLDKGKKKGRIAGVLAAMEQGVLSNKAKIETTLRVIAKAEIMLDEHSYEVDAETLARTQAADILRTYTVKMASYTRA